MSAEPLVGKALTSIKNALLFKRQPVDSPSNLRSRIRKYVKECRGSVRKDEVVESQLALFMAAYKDDVSVLKELLRQEVGIEARVPAVNATWDGPLCNQSYDNCTALLVAAQARSMGCITVLLEHGANPDPVHHSASSPLTTVMKLWYLQNRNVVVQALLAAGANPNPACQPDEPLLSQAVRLTRSQGLVKILLEGGTDVNATDSEGNTPLDVAAKFSDLETVKMLIEAGADVIHRSEKGETVLCAALEAPDIEVFYYLLEQKKELALNQNKRNATVLHASAVTYSSLLTSHTQHEHNYCRHCRNWSGSCRVDRHLVTAEALLAAGADVDAIDIGGNTPLHYAVHAKDLGLAKLLLKNGAKDDIRNKQGRTAEALLAEVLKSTSFNEAAWEARLEIHQLLSSHGPTCENDCLAEKSWDALHIRHCRECGRDDERERYQQSQRR